MRVVRRAFLASTLASLAAPAVMRWARADAPPIALKLHHSFSAVSCVHDKFLVPWVRKVEAEAAGRLRIDIFPSMELGGAPAQLFDQARAGDADIVWTAPGSTPGRFPKIETFELPFLPARRALVSSKALEDFAALYLKDEFADIRPLGFSCSDRGVIHSYAPVRTVEDVKDAKLQVQTRLAAEAMRTLGAQPVPMPSAQLPAALAARVVDGCVDPWHLVPPLRLSDALKAHTEFSDWSLSSRVYVLAMNKDAYERLPRELKAVIDNNSGQPAADLAGAMWDVQAATVAENVAERGDVIVTLLPEAVAHWRRATEPVVTAWLKEMKEAKVDGAKMLASAHTLLAKYATEPEPQSPQIPPSQQQAVGEPPPRSAGVTTVPERVAAPVAQPAPPPAPHAAPVAQPAPPPAPHTAPAAQPAPPSVPHLAPQMVTRAPPPAPPVAPVAKPAAAAAAPALQPPPTLAPAVPAVPAAPSLPKTLNIPL